MIKSQKIIDIDGHPFQVTEYEPDGPSMFIPIIERIPGKTEIFYDENDNVIGWIKHETIVLGEEQPLNSEPIAEK